MGITSQDSRFKIQGTEGTNCLGQKYKKITISGVIHLLQGRPELMVHDITSF
jgi:hypothetical protein